MKMKSGTTIAVAILVVFLMVQAVFASGPGFSGITANADSAETVITNPAGMTRFSEPTIYGNPMVIYTKSKTEVKVEGTEQKETIDNDSFAAMPGIYYVHPLNKKWSAGIGPTATTGLGSTYNDKWAGRYFLKEWSLNFVGIAPSAAYRFNDRLSVGASVPIMYSM
jgi:long-chain fatty acid transport protein